MQATRLNWRMFHFFWWWSLSLLLLVGCSNMQPARTAADLAAEPVEPLTLSAGDVIDVKFFYTPELDESQIVRPDGFISLQLVGDVRVDHLTPAGLQQELLRRYTPHLKNPKITVLVRRVYDARVWVTGEVKRPGPVQMNGKLTVLEAVMEVGGGTRPTADLAKVLVVRQKNDGRHYGCLVNLQEVLQGREGQQFFLHPRDVVFVPPTSITRANDWVDQYINKMMPQARTIVEYPIGPGGRGTAGIDTSSR
uniref:polysaccharide biosynthesis/export family protein n=1 Tax=Desulfobacca sp. TaxID=2067990 RepID=UPI00404A1A7C